MFCARCGEQIPEASELCPLCGRETSIQLQPQSSTGQAATSAAPMVSMGIHAEQSWSALERPINPNLKGIGGWLGFFCVSTTILSPLVVFISLSAGTQFSSIVLALLSITVFGVIAGATVWMKSPWAIPLLRVYFLMLGGFALLRAVLQLATGLEDGDVSILFIHLRTVGVVLLWAAYFHKSERVRATLGRNL